MPLSLLYKKLIRGIYLIRSGKLPVAAPAELISESLLPGTVPLPIMERAKGKWPGYWIPMLQCIPER
jgi:hypothetical protein